MPDDAVRVEPADEGFTTPEREMSEEAEMTNAPLRGILELNCDEAVSALVDVERKCVLAAHDPQGGGITGARVFDIPPGATFHVWLEGPYHLRRKFDQNFERMAIEWEQLADGSTHAGYVDYGGNVVDVTALRDRGGFRSTPRDMNPMFAPDGNRLAVYSDPKGEVMELSLDDGALRPWRGPGYATGPTYTIASGGWVVDQAADQDQVLPNPSGTFASGSYSITFPNDGYREFRGGQRAACPPEAWLTDNYYACSTGGAHLDEGEILFVYVDPSGGRTRHWQLTPDTTRVNYNPISSPDGSRVAFISTEGEISEIYVVPTNKRRPTLVGSVVGELVDWLP